MGKKIFLKASVRKDGKDYIVTTEWRDKDAPVLFKEVNGILFDEGHRSFLSSTRFTIGYDAFGKPVECRVRGSWVKKDYPKVLMQAVAEYNEWCWERWKETAEERRVEAANKKGEALYAGLPPLTSWWRRKDKAEAFQIVGYAAGHIHTSTGREISFKRWENEKNNYAMDSWGCGRGYPGFLGAIGRG